jgi:hypothetical protein
MRRGRRGFKFYLRWRAWRLYFCYGPLCWNCWFRCDRYLLQVSDNRVRFPPLAQEASYGFFLQAWQKAFRRRL